MPVVAASVLVLLRCPEPRLHRADESMSLSAHTVLTFRTLTRASRLLPIIGMHWAGLTAGFGIAGVLADLIRLDRPPPRPRGRVPLSNPATAR